MTRQKDAWNGKNLREMFRTGTKLLHKNASAVNSLNVFPVPDGDTGTNMLLTMQSAIAEANLCPDNDASAVAQAMAKGALMGARGNSGVILSQVLHGLSQGMGNKKSFTGMDMASALVKASQSAYNAMSQPAEGTMLTVMREASAVAQATSYAGFYNLESIIEATVKEAMESVERTPQLLPVLKEAGVVDAGGYGLALILEGLLLYLRGTDIPDEELNIGTAAQPVILQQQEETVYGYCTEFMINGEALDLNTIRARLAGLGDSLLVVGDQTTARVHIHTFDPGQILSYGTSLGTLRQIKIDNMQDQHREFLAAQNGSTPAYIGKVSTIAVASGDGLVKVFESLGTTYVLPGGETMNPSVQEMLQAVESMMTDEVIILPNNPDILPAARQINGLTRKKVSVIPTKTIPQGITAMMSFHYESELEANVKAMKESLSTVRTGQISTAVRSMKFGSLKVQKDQIIGLIDKKLSVAESTLEGTFKNLLQKMKAEEGEIITIYYGGKVNLSEAERLLESVRPDYPELETELIFGGQPHYDYIISIE